MTEPKKKRRAGWTSRFVWEVMYGGVSLRTECWFTEPQLGSNPADFHKPDWAEQAKALALARRKHCEVVHKPISCQS